MVLLPPLLRGVPIVVVAVIVVSIAAAVVRWWCIREVAMTQKIERFQRENRFLSLSDKSLTLEAKNQTLPKPKLFYFLWVGVGESLVRNKQGKFLSLLSI